VECLYLEPKDRSNSYQRWQWEHRYSLGGMGSGRKLSAKNQIGNKFIMASAPSSQFKNALMGATIMIIRVGTVNNPVEFS
jgi:hypothetical protein